MPPDLAEQLANLQRAFKAGHLDEATYQAVVAALNAQRAVHVDSGAVAQGENATAVGAGGMLIQGDINGNVIIVTQHAASDFWQQFQTQTPDLTEVTAAYLKYLVNRYRYLDFKGMGISQRVALRLPLLPTYVPLKARLHLPEGDTWNREEPLPGDPQPLLDLLDDQDGLIVLGDPGAGKTTFLKYLVLQLAQGKGESVGLGYRLPLVLSLSAYATALQESDLPLDRFLARFYRNLGLDLPLEKMIKESLAQGGALLLLDGLDEIQEPRWQHVLVDRLTAFYNIQRRHGNKFIITSRLVGYRDVRPVADGLVECTLVDFEWTQIEQFVQQWTLALEQAAQGDTAVAVTDAAQEQRDLLSVLQRNERVRRLATNPLLLTILALMKRQGVVLPERRIELYDQYVRTLISHWNLARSLNRPPSRDLDLVETMHMLAPLALWLQEEVGGYGVVAAEKMQRQLKAILLQRGRSHPEQTARQFLADIQNHAGLLVERGPDRYGFMHLTFQEYTAAVAVAMQGQRTLEPVLNTLLAHIDDDSWREIIVLTIGTIGVIQQREEAASELIRGLLTAPEMPRDRLLLLAGEAAVAAWPGGITQTCRADVAQALLWSLQEPDTFAVSVRVEAGRILGRLGDPRPNVMTVDEMVFCYVPGGPFQMGDGEASHENQTLAQPYWIGRFPVTQAQYEAFTLAGGYEQEALWREAAAVGRWQPGQIQDWERRGWRKRPFTYGYPFDLPNHPVVGVTWFEALAFARWLTQQWQASGLLAPGWQVQLPSEAEWEKAASGGPAIPTAPLIRPVAEVKEAMETAVSTQLNPFPKKNLSCTPNDANMRASGVETTSAVGCFSGATSPYGCQEMLGNVWEWTRSRFQPYPYDPADGRERPNVELYEQIALRGGAYWNETPQVSATFRSQRSPNDCNSSYGFRLVLHRQP